MITYLYKYVVCRLLDSCGTNITLFNMQRDFYQPNYLILSETLEVSTLIKM